MNGFSFDSSGRATEGFPIRKKDQAFENVRGLDYTMLRSVLSVIAGIAVLTATSFAIEAVMDPLLLRVFPLALPNPTALSTNHWVRALTFAYGLMCVAAGGYIAARIASRLPIRHAAAMGIVQAGLTIVAMLSPEANHATRLQWIATAILSIPAALAGGLFIRAGRTTKDWKNFPRVLSN